MPGEAEGLPGLYGKLPARGDFVRRRLPLAFVEPWDGWLQEAIVASRRALGERWLDVYLTSPMWRFALSAGLCGEPAAAGRMACARSVFWMSIGRQPPSLRT